MIHREGEFMISRAAGYHSGFNFGFNIAEAVNFALDSWLDIASKVACCNCVHDSVRINMGSFVKNILQNKEIIQKMKNKAGFNAWKNQQQLQLEEQKEEETLDDTLRLSNKNSPSGLERVVEKGNSQSRNQ